MEDMDQASNPIKKEEIMDQTGEPKFNELEDASKPQPLLEMKIPNVKREEESNPQPLSKSALKKIAKRQSWLDTKAERKAIQKVKRKEKVELNKKLGFYQMSYSARRKKLKNAKMELSACKVNVVLDMSFDDLMSDRDLGKCMKQLMHCYSINRRLSEPLQFHVSNLNGRAKSIMETRHSGYTSWDCNFHPETYIETFTSPPYNRAKSDIVYLTSDSENVIGSSLDPEKIYIIGGLVDHNKQKGHCHKMAVENGVSHARFPIDEYIHLKTRKVFTIDHVYQILSKVASAGQTWKEALLSTLPERKGAREIGDDDDDDDDDLDNGDSDNTSHDSKEQNEEKTVSISNGEGKESDVETSDITQRASSDQLKFLKQASPLTSNA